MDASGMVALKLPCFFAGIRAKKEKQRVKILTKRNMKLVNGLSKNLSMFSSMRLGVHPEAGLTGEAHGKLISEHEEIGCHAANASCSNGASTSFANTSFINGIVGEDSTEGTNHLMKPSVDVAEPGYRWRLVIAYDGTRYAGWQFQESPPTVQCVVEKALTRVTKLQRKDLHFVGASRTDTGVHAWGQVAHFITPCNYDNLENIHSALNGLLPSDIRVREISAAVPEFHARFSAKSKIYHYKIYNDTVEDPLSRHYAYHNCYKLNAGAMREAAKYFVGRHDFSAFVNASRNDRVPDPVKTIFRFDLLEMGALLQLEVEGSGFLYRQVRNMVALLVQIGKEAIPPDIVPSIMETRDRKELAKYAFAAPPHGLCLVSIKYKKDHLRLPPGCPMTSFGRHYSISKCKLPFY